MNSTENSTVTGARRLLGLTIVEMLIALSVAAVILVVGTPAATYGTQIYHFRSTSSAIMESINLGQNEAEKRYSTVRICPSSDGIVCREDGDWNRGWLVFSDGNDNHVPDRIEPLKYFGPPHQTVQVQAAGAFRQSASFTLAGIVNANDTNVGSFRICPLGTVGGSITITVDLDGLTELKKSAASCSDS